MIDLLFNTNPVKILKCLFINPGISQVDISRLAEIKSYARTTYIIKELKCAGLVICDKKGRDVKCILSDKGNAVYTCIQEIESLDTGDEHAGQ